LVYVYLRCAVIVIDRMGEDVTKQIHVKLSASLHRRLKVQATMHDKTMQEYVLETLEDRISGDEALGVAAEHWKGD
jgi:predicted HicB family RNase H-like nuclease